MTTATPSVQALIMAGGRGERLYPLTASRPKPAIPFGGYFGLWIESRGTGTKSESFVIW